MIKQQILEDLSSAIKKAGFKASDIDLSISENDQFGDYSSNIALKLSNQKNVTGYQSSIDIANKIADMFGHPGYLERVDIAGPGFINFYLRGQILIKEINQILVEGDSFGYSQKFQSQNARVEFVSANPTGPLHIGNARGGPLGDTIANILSACGYQVFREYIHNDIGGQVKKLGSTLITKMGHPSLAQENQDKQLFYLGSYIDELAASVKKIMIDSLGKEAYGKIDQVEAENIAGKIGVDLLLKEIMDDLEAIGIRFDKIFYESELQEESAEVIDQLRESGVIKEQEGALWFAPNDEFLKDRETVVRKSDGNYTYFTSDIVYHKKKFESGADLIIDVFGSNHHGHVPRLQAAAAALGFDPAKLKFVLYQYVRVKRGDQIVKMSKRAGDFVLAREVLDEVGRDAFRFMLLRSSSQTHLDFDLDLVKQQSSKNPVYYVQYAHARMANILAKVENFSQTTEKLGEEAELSLVKHLLQFPELLEEISGNLEVHKLTDYSIRLADLFHKFYERCPVIMASDPLLRDSRLNLVKASKTVLANSLSLMGISAPERM